MTTTRFHKFAALATALTLITGVGLALPASAAPAATRYITLSSTGSVTVVPDAVRINANVTIVAGSTKEATAATATAAAAVRVALLANGIAKADIATQSISVYPEYEYTQERGSQIIGYRATQNFVVKVKKADTAGVVVDAVIAAGGDAVQLQGVTPFVSDTSKAIESARTVAVKSAKSKAKSYAKLLGIKLGRVNYLVEDSSPIAYRPIMALGKAADSQATVVDLGEQEVSVSVTVQWALL
jgi:uncharacterized protein